VLLGDVTHVEMTATATATAAPRRADVDDVLDILSSEGDDELAEIVQLACSICGSDAAGITIRRDDEYHVPITHGIEPFVCAADETFCQMTMDTYGLFAVEDALAHPQLAHIGLVDGRMARARSYASAPIYDPAGTMVGRLCVIGKEPKQLSEMQVRALETLGLSASKLIELRLLRAAPLPEPPPDRYVVAALLAQITAEHSHDLKVPLTAMVASLEMLQERLGDSTDQVVSLLLHRSTSAASRMTRMVDQHLRSAAASVDGLPVARTDLTGVAREVVGDCAAILEPLGATVVVDQLPLVRANRDEMYSVFQNLIVNSVKFARPGVPACVHVTALADHDGWRIAVVDNGVGIPPDRRTDVFSLFSRASAEVEGHGIGLATVSRIVTAHGGHAGAAEAPGGGTEIWFTLPAA
jgi:signal transduction histidine kinase